MFRYCSSLNKVVSYITSPSSMGSTYTSSWLQNVSSTGDFYNLGGVTFASGANGIPSGWTQHTSL